MTQADAIRLVAAALTQFPPLTQGQRDKLEEIAAARFSDEPPPKEEVQSS
jgi:hypothetical protein